MCVFDVGDGIPCGELEWLEFHEPFGEEHQGEGRFQQRMLVCPNHHDQVHGGKVYNGGFPTILSCVAPDVDMEIRKCRGYWPWVKRYNLDPSRAGCLLPGEKIVLGEQSRMILEV